MQLAAAPYRASGLVQWPEAEASVARCCGCFLRYCRHCLAHAPGAKMTPNTRSAEPGSDVLCFEPQGVVLRLLGRTTRAAYRGTGSETRPIRGRTVQRLACDQRQGSTLKLTA